LFNINTRLICGQWPPNSPDHVAIPVDLCLEYSAGESVRNSIREHRWNEVQTSSGIGKTGSRNHCISDQTVASPS